MTFSASDSSPNTLSYNPPSSSCTACAHVHLYVLTAIINLQQICAMRGWNENSPDSESIKARLMAVWDGLQQSADDDQDGQVRKTRHLLKKWINWHFSRNCAQTLTYTCTVLHLHPSISELSRIVPFRWVRHSLILLFWQLADQFGGMVCDVGIVQQ